MILDSSTKGAGSWQPGTWKDAAEVTGNDELKGVAMPLGKLESVAAKYLMYNEVSS